MPPMTRDQDWFGRQLMPYRRDADHFVYHVAKKVSKKVDNNDKKFAVELDVSHSNSEELEVHLEGGDLTIEGKHGEKSVHGFSVVRPQMGSIGRLRSRCSPRLAHRCYTSLHRGPEGWTVHAQKNPADHACL
ncbi:hypothetical protein ANCCAN_19760 [Ancylostoma caninum]|uniref:SHSP domain-containing protein n=1 Tax=Ancylostoma caninum TaxID=29170 RepID=A0A368FVU0_ANCCA|nr:hypothetical protein ANCCAN_19760 [Ancylostoma caninum]